MTPRASSICCALLALALSACGGSVFAPSDAGSPSDGGAGSSGGGNGGGSGGGSGGGASGGSGGASDGGPVTGDCRIHGCPSSAAYCVNGWTIARATASGTCDTSTGDCTFQYAVKACEQPDAGTCNGNELDWFQSPGTCAESAPGVAACSYAKVSSTCAQGCSAGACSGLSCSSDAHACGAICVADDSVDHCGEVNCGACDAPANATASCTYYACEFACNDGYALCGQSCAACPAGTSPHGGTCANDRCISSACSGAHAWPGNGRCYSWDSDNELTTVNSPDGQIAVGAAGNVHLAWMDGSTETQDGFGLIYDKWDRSANTWHQQTVAPAVNQIFAVTVDAQDRPAIAYLTQVFATDIGTLHVAWWNGTGFSITDITTGFNPNHTYLGAAMVAQGDGTLHLAWDLLDQSTGYHLWHTTLAAGVVASEEVSSGALVSGINVGIALDAQNVPWVAAFQTNTQTPSITVAHKSNSSWSLDTVNVTGASVLSQSDLRLSSTGVPFVVAYDRGGPILLSKVSGQWLQRAVPYVTNTDFGWTIDPQDLLLGIAPSDNGLVMASTTDGTVDGALTLAVLPDTDSEPADFIRVAVDPTGGAFMLARSYSGGLELMHFR